MRIFTEADLKRSDITRSLSSCQGFLVKITLLSDLSCFYEGLLFSVTENLVNSVELVLKGVELKETVSNSTLQTFPSFPIKADNIFSIEVIPNSSLSSFQTDASITHSSSSSSLRRSISSGKPRSLQKWEEEVQTEVLTNENNTSKWDQFEANEKLFGIKSTFDENLYTIPIDKSSKEYLSLEKEAGKIANEIMSKRIDSHHSDEDKDYSDEEERFSSVIRTSEQSDNVSKRPDSNLNPFAKEFVPSEKLSENNSQEASYNYSPYSYYQNPYAYVQPYPYCGSYYAANSYNYPSYATPVYSNNSANTNLYAQKSQSADAESINDTAIIVSISNNASSTEINKPEAN